MILIIFLAIVWFFDFNAYINSPVVWAAKLIWNLETNGAVWT